MSVDKATVRHIAHLARIGVEDADLEPLVGELNNILAWIEQLNEVDTADVSPLDGVHDGQSRWRADEVNDGGFAQDIVDNAPEPQEQFFTVPKVVE